MEHENTHVSRTYNFRIRLLFLYSQMALKFYVFPSSRVVFTINFMVFLTQFKSLPKITYSPKAVLQCLVRLCWIIFYQLVSMSVCLRQFWVLKRLAWFRPKLHLFNECSTPGPVELFVRHFSAWRQLL